jgi:hypothetical protein
MAQVLEHTLVNNGDLKQVHSDTCDALESMARILHKLLEAWAKKSGDVNIETSDVTQSVFKLIVIMRRYRQVTTATANKK